MNKETDKYLEKELIFIMTITIEEIYQEILDGKRRRFPNRTWHDDERGELIQKLTRYLIEEVLEWNDEQIKENWGIQLIRKMKLAGGCNIHFNDSPYKMLNHAYPNRFKEYEFKNTPNNFWTKEKALKVLHDWIDNKEKLTREQLLDVYGVTWLKERYLDTPLQKYWNSSPYKMLDDAYPNQFNEQELKNAPCNFWEDATKSLKIFKETIQKQNMSMDDIKEQYSLKWILENGLHTPLKKFWNSSPYKMLNAAYPNHFHEWELKDAPNGTWTNKENAKKIIKNEIDKSDLSVSQLLDRGVEKWMKEKKLLTPYYKHWNASALRMLKEIYPEEFRKQIDNG